MTDLALVFEALRSIMRPYASKLDCVSDTQDQFHVNTKHIQKNNKPLFFGAVRLNKNYVSYHLMPVYVNPHLLASLSPELKKRMQGKSCFNFRRVDTALLEELATLTEAGFEAYKRAGCV